MTGVEEVVKQVLNPFVLLVPQAGPTVWMPMPVMDDRLLAPVRTRLMELNVPFAPFPVTSKQRVWPAMPPQVPAPIDPLPV